jgi:hypothetical protein
VQNTPPVCGSGLSTKAYLPSTLSQFLPLAFALDIVSTELSAWYDLSALTNSLFQAYLDLARRQTKEKKKRKEKDKIQWSP